MTTDANDLTPPYIQASEPSIPKTPFCAINSQPTLADFYSYASEAIYIGDKSFLPHVVAYIYRNKIAKIYIDTETAGLDPFTNDLILVQVYAGYKIFLINTVLIGTDKTLHPYLSLSNTLVIKS